MIRVAATRVMHYQGCRVERENTDGGVIRIIGGDWDDTADSYGSGGSNDCGAGYTNMDDKGTHIYQSDSGGGADTDDWDDNDEDARADADDGGDMG